MSIRYGVALIPEPRFTARVYRARQLICGQYASWAAEMHMLHLPLADYFPCPEDAVESVSAGLGRIAREGQWRRRSGMPLAHRGVAVGEDGAGDIFLDFAVPEDTPRSSDLHNLKGLHEEVLELLGQVQGTVPDLRSAGARYRPRIMLMQRANLPRPVLESAVEFARAVVQDLEIPERSHGWQLAFTRFRSDAAGEDWDNGRWAADLSWQLLASYPL